MQRLNSVALFICLFVAGGAAVAQSDKDYCPEDPDKTTPGLCGCGTPDTDSDHNHVPDCFGNNWRPPPVNPPELIAPISSGRLNFSDTYERWYEPAPVGVLNNRTYYILTHHKHEWYWGGWRYDEWLHRDLTWIELWQTNGYRKASSKVKVLMSWEGLPEHYLNPTYGITPGGAAAGEKLYFTFDDQRYGTQLWVSDGTASGTFMVKRIGAGLAANAPLNFTAVGSLMFFTASDGTAGRELWRSDGTSAGTFMLRDIRSGTESSAPALLTSFKNKLYFTANDGINGLQLWTSDGTSAGTAMVAGFTSEAPLTINELAVSGERLFLSLGLPSLGTELWASDGTAVGTYLVKDIAPGALSSGVKRITADNKNGVLFFADEHGGLKDPLDEFKATGFDLWKSDGLEPGTQHVYDMNAAPATLLSPIYVTGARSYFIRDTYLYQTDGLAQNTYPCPIALQVQAVLGLAGDTFILIGLWPTDETNTTFSKALVRWDASELEPREVSSGTKFGVTDGRPPVYGQVFVVNNRIVFATSNSSGKDRAVWAITDNQCAGITQTGFTKKTSGVCGCGMLDADTDEDNVPDCIDQCPNDEHKLVPASCGCGQTEDDFDQDGALNCLDGCPFDPNKREPTGCGCGRSDTADSDGDKVLDCLDGCMLDKTKTAPGVCGCSIPDADDNANGILDCREGMVADLTPPAPALRIQRKKVRVSMAVLRQVIYRINWEETYTKNRRKVVRSGVLLTPNADAKLPNYTRGSSVKVTYRFVNKDNRRIVSKRSPSASIRVRR